VIIGLGQSLVSWTGLRSGDAARLMKPSRDHRIDFLRGLALVMIFINHIPGVWAGGLTSRNFGFSDAAELFVLLAGYAAAVAYGPHMATHGFIASTRRALGRAGVLYGAHLLTTVSAVLLFWGLFAATGTSQDKDLIGVSAVILAPWSHVGSILLGGVQLSYFNILPLYVVLLLALPLMLWVAGYSLAVLGLASMALYLATNIGGWSLAGLSDGESWFFNPLAWQGVFVLGLVLGLRACQGKTVSYSMPLYALAMAYVVGAAVWMVGQCGPMLGPEWVPSWIGSLDKPNLPLSRLVHVAALAYVMVHSAVWYRLSLVPKTCVLTRMGRNSLPVFMVGSLLSMLGWIIIETGGGGFALQTVVVAAGLAVLAALALWLEGALAIRISLRPFGQPLVDAA
jgi:hypothetical protein